MFHVKQEDEMFHVKHAEGAAGASAAAADPGSLGEAVAAVQGVHSESEGVEPSRRVVVLKD